MNRLELVRRAAGALALLFLLLLIVSGWGLAANYVPSDTEAFSSVLYMRHDLALGPALRSAHHYLTNGLVVAGFVFLAATLLGGRLSERPVAWWLATGLYLIVLGICFTGYLLPMDQNAYWGTVVRLGIVETIPVLGPSLARLLRGGAVFNASTLPRFYVLHAAILPTLALALAWPLVRPVASALEREPGRMLRWLAFTLMALGAVYLVAASVGAPLELRADPAASEYVPRPEWYFLWLFQLGKYVEAVPWVESLLVPLGGIGLLAALPWLTPSRLGGRMALVAGWAVVWTLLTGLALWEDRELPPKLPYEEAMRVRSERLYKDLCYECHGPEGRGNGPQSRAFDLDSRDFTRAEFWRESREIDLERSIRDGKGKDMPAFGRQLAADEIDALLDYVRQRFAPSEVLTPSPKETK